MYPAAALKRRSDLDDPPDGADDHRSRFAQDRDRLLYSSAFRRLAGKSQVVASIELGSFHTRLTHSLKVAQLGRRLSEALQAQQEGQDRGPDPDLVEFACLAHDLGHPPFGHAGESELHRSIEKKLEVSPSGDTQDFEKVVNDRLELGGFEGNPQSLRLVSRLAHKWLRSDGEPGPPPDWFGLDPTAAALDAVTKYPWERTTSNLKKWGSYGRCDTSDTATLRWAREATGADPVMSDDAKKCFEAQLMDWCDDVTYAVHDVEDFYQIGFIPLELLFASDPTDVWEEFRDWLHEKWTAAGRDVTPETLDAVRSNLADFTFHTAVVPGSFTGTNTERRLAHKRTSGLIRRFVDSVTYEGDPFLHNGSFKRHPDTDRDEELQLECDVLKELIWRYVIDSPSLATQQEGHRRIIRDLVDIYCEADQVLPVHLREMLDNYEQAVGYNDPVLAKLRVVSDHVSSLTEQHAISLHRRLIGADPGGFRDLI